MGVGELLGTVVVGIIVILALVSSLFASSRRHLSLFGMSLLPHYLFVLYCCPCSASLRLSYVYLLCLLHYTFAIHNLYYFSNALGLFNQPIFTFVIIHHPISCIP